MVWSCFPFIRSGQNHLARHSERGKKTRQIEEEVGRQHQGMDRPRVRQVPEGSGEQGKIEKTGCKIIRGAPTTLTVKGLMMMMMKTAAAAVVVFNSRYTTTCFSCSLRSSVTCPLLSFSVQPFNNGSDISIACKHYGSNLRPFISRPRFFFFWGGEGEERSGD